MHRDLDGAVCAILLRKVFPDIKVIATTYAKINELFDENILKSSVKYDNIFITDISIDEERFKDFINESSNIHFIDHHPREVKSIIKSQLHNTNFSGCLLTRAFLSRKYGIEFDKKMGNLVKFGNDFDLWIHQYGLSKILNRVYYYYNFDKFIERFKDGFDTFNDEEMQFIKKNNEYLKNVIKNLEYVKLTDYLIVTHTSEGNIDEIGDYLLKFNQGVDTVFIYNTASKSLSLRGKYNGVDYGQFLKQFGGGGHKEAAGLKVTLMSDLEKVIESYVEERDKLCQADGLSI